MKNTEQLLASQYLVKSAFLGAMGKGLLSFGRFAKKNPFAAGGIGLGTLAASDLVKAIQGRNETISRFQPLRDFVANSPVLNKSFGPDSIFGVNRSLHPEFTHSGIVPPRNLYDIRPGLRYDKMR